MTSFLMNLSGLIVEVARIHYLDGYFFATVLVAATIVVNACVIHFIYQFKS